MSLIKQLLFVCLDSWWNFWANTGLFCIFFKITNWKDPKAVCFDCNFNGCCIIISIHLITDGFVIFWNQTLKHWAGIFFLNNYQQQTVRFVYMLKTQQSHFCWTNMDTNGDIFNTIVLGKTFFSKNILSFTFAVTRSLCPHSWMADLKATDESQAPPR